MKASMENYNDLEKLYFAVVDICVWELLSFWLGVYRTRLKLRTRGCKILSISPLSSSLSMYIWVACWLTLCFYYNAHEFSIVFFLLTK